MRKAVLYLRRSTDMQEQSIPDQRTALEVYAKDHHSIIVREFVDDAVSGTSTEGRDAFNAMVKAALNGERLFEAILVWDIRRFSLGDVDEAGYYRHLLRQHGVEVIYVAENLTGDDTDDLIIGTKQWLARQESKDKSKVTFRGMLSLVEKGHWAGGPAPYGYDRALFDHTGRLLRVVKVREPSRMAPGDYVTLVLGDTQKVQTVRRMFELYVQRGLGFRAIVTLLNQEGVPSPNGGRWSVVTVQTLLRNPAYKGAVVWNKSSHGRFHILSKHNDQFEIRSIGQRPATSITRRNGGSSLKMPMSPSCPKSCSPPPRPGAARAVDDDPPVQWLWGEFLVSVVGCAPLRAVRLTPAWTHQAPQRAYVCAVCLRRLFAVWQ